MDAGVKIFGFGSRVHPQKSLAIFARRKYGDGNIDYQIFPDKEIFSFESIALRNSGGDWMQTMFRDGLMASLLKDTNLKYQAFRPSIVFLNGDYRGIYNIREKMNEHFLADNYGINPDDVDYLESNQHVMIGDGENYMEMMDFLENNNLSIPSNYNVIENWIEIDNIISYMVCEIFYDNIDWPGANIKFFRERDNGAKWHWQIYHSSLEIR